MKKNIFEIIQRQSLRLSLCALALSFCTVTFAQDDFDDEEETIGFKAPKRKVVADKNPLMTVSGSVVDVATGQPVAGVRVNAVGNNKYTGMTNAEGKFTVKVPTFTTSLYVTAPRYLAQQVAINEKDEKQEVKVALLSTKFKEMYEESTPITAQASFKTKGGSIVIDDEIQANLGADIRSINRSGAIDGGNAMFIRGINSINANSQPLIIIDGVEYDMQQDRTPLHIGRSFNMLANISPEDIDKVQVLKNATALYGARGANGVILIDTKRGHSQATRIDANISAGINLVPTTQKVMNAAQYRNYATEMLGTIPQLKLTENRNIRFDFLNDDPNNFYYHTYHNDTDWQNEVYNTSITQNYSINVQGGDDIGMYNLSVGYVDSNRPVKETNFNRLNVRFNTDINLLANLSTKFDMSFSRTNTSLYDDGFAEDMTKSTVLAPGNLAAIKSPLLSTHQYNKYAGGFTTLLSDYDLIFGQMSKNLNHGKDYVYSLANPVSILENGEGDMKNKVENTYFNVRIEPTFEFNRHLKATTMFSYLLNRNSQRYYRPTEGVPPFDVEGLGTVYNQASSLFAMETNIVSDTHVDWSNIYGAHAVAVKGGFRFNSFSYDGTDAKSQFKKTVDDKNPYLTSKTADAFPSLAGAADTWKNMQWYVNGDYNYKNRYFATLSLLAESNSRFGDNAAGSANIAGVRWAFFPSVQLGWVVSNEKWFPKNGSINYFRINAGFDMSGNDGISNYASRTFFTSVRYNANAIGMQLANIGNDEIKWETTTKWNLGFLVNAVNNRISFGLDFYNHRTRDLLTLQTFSSPIAGINQYWTNSGTLENVGFEAKFSVKPIVSKDWNLELGFSMGSYSNEVIELPERGFTDGKKQFTDGSYTVSAYGDNNLLVTKGRSVGVFYGYQTDGIFSTDAEASKAHNGEDYLYVVDNTGQKTAFKAGDVHFVDLNGDGVIDERDKTVIGNANPDLYGNIFATLNYKRFTLDLGFNYSLGGDIYNYQRSILNSGSNFYNQQVAELDHWRYEGQVASLPRLNFGDPMGNNRFSDRWIEDGSYLKLKNVRLTYQIPLPDAWTGWLQGLTVWGEAQNVFTITKYTGNDPETSVGNGVFYQGIDAGMIAQSRAFIFGLKINL